MSFVDDFTMALDGQVDQDVPMAEPVVNIPVANDDDEGQEAEEGEGKRLSDADDSSEEEDEDEDAVREVREGFIVDEEEDDDDDDEEERRRRHKKRKKSKHRRRREEMEEDLDEDDLELLEENTGGRVRSRQLTRLRRGRDSESPEASSSKRKAVVESSDEGIDEDNIIDSRKPQDIQNIWDDERAGRDDDDEGDMDDFIEYEEEEEEGAGAMAEEEREARRRERRKREKERRKVFGSRPELTGMDANTWDEIQEVFGDGHDYDWALDDSDEEGILDDTAKAEIKMDDVFEPSVIKARLLTEDDDLIRAQDVPERMQLATSTLSQYATLSFPEPLTQDECQDAASWVTPKLGKNKERDFFRADGVAHHLLGDLVQAVTRVLEYLFIQTLEVPYIYVHRRDYLWSFNPANIRGRQELLNLDDLWRIYNLGQKYRSLLQRRKALHAIYQKLNVSDEYYEERLKDRTESVEGVADISQWLALKYKAQKRDSVILGFDDDERSADKKHKLPNRTSAYDIAKRSIISRLADGFGIKSHEVVQNFLSGGQNLHFVEDHDLPPVVYAEQFADPDPAKALPSEELLRQARMIIATELGHDPLLRQYVRDQFKQHAQVSCLPTDRGKIKIDLHHAYNNFKYLYNKPVTEMLDSTQILLIFAAESEHLVTVSIFLPIDVKQDLQHRLTDAFSSDSFSDAAKAWNDERALVIQEAVEKHLLPAGAKWIREHLREEVEDTLARRCAVVLYERINSAPYRPPNFEEGQIPSILAISWGKGDPKKDEINMVVVDEEGRMRENAQVENLSDTDNEAQFRDLLKRRRPDVIVVGGYTISTTNLAKRVKEILRPQQQNDSDQQEETRNEQPHDIPVIYMTDDVARLFQHSKRADEEFNYLPLTGRYCVGLARYAQSPLNEFTALGTDITAITFDDESQPLVPKEKLLVALERVLVDVVNKVGVDINRAVIDPYYAHVLPYVAGLGPRKAHALVKKIAGLGGNLVNREQFIKSTILTTRIFLNAAGFLRIVQSEDYKDVSSRRGGGREDYSNLPDPLDDTRIHPEDYELARKMATDALELDEEDVHDEHPSHVVEVLMKDEDNTKKLDELNLDEFAVNMYETNQDIKRLTLTLIRSELLKPFGEARKPFTVPDASDVLTMLTGETTRTLRAGVIVTVLIVRPTPSFVLVRLDSGIEGTIKPEHYDDGIYNHRSIIKGTTKEAVISDVTLSLEEDSFTVELVTREAEVSIGDNQFRTARTDDRWNYNQATRDDELLVRKKRAEVNKTRRVIKHPNFHNLSSSQAETFLEKQPPGDVVIRPSSKGANHLAVTWKVADGVYQHVDVLDMNPDPSTQGVGTQLIVEGKYEFSDLDELIVNHIKAMSRRVEELMAHEKFKKSDNELEKYLIDYVKMHPAKSIYGFSLNRKKPGHFNLSFLAKKGSTIQTWPVRVAPEAYYLFDAAAAGVSELCDAFKVRHLHESQNMGAAGSKTPYGAGRMTPARTPGYTTPGRVSVRQPVRTPNPYSGPPQGSAPGAGPVPNAYGGASSSHAPSASYGTTPSLGANGWQTPSFGGAPQNPQGPPPGMHPGRAALIQQSGNSAWTPGGGGRW